MTATMLVATHKAAPLPEDGFHLPVHVGHALNPVDLGYQPDDQGEHISDLNRSYCELTALYWAWRNHDADIVGLSHYRRYFVGDGPAPSGKTGILTEAEAQDLMRRYDVVLGRRRNYVVETIESHYRNGHHGSDLDRLREVIDQRCPEYRPSLEKILQGRMLSLYNMFLMRRETFDAYCSWLFPILEEFSAGLDVTDRDAYQQRVAGYLGERLLNVWVLHHSGELRVNRRPIVNTEGEPKIQKGIGMIRRKFSESL